MIPVILESFEDEGVSTMTPIEQRVNTSADDAWFLRTRYRIPPFLSVTT